MMGAHTRRTLAIVAAAASCAACSSLPSSAPTQRDVAVAAQDPKSGLPFAIVDLSPELVERMEAQTGTQDPFAMLPIASAVDVIGAGDGLQVSIFEVGPSLFSGRSGAATPGAGSNPSAVGEALPVIVVARDGMATVPYVGRLRAAGRTPGELADAIRAGLAQKSQAPEVVVGIRDNVAETVVVSGDVKKPGRYPLTLDGERVLDAIALAGGVANALQDEQVHVQRGAVSVIAPLVALQAGSRDDVLLGPHDRVEILYRPRTYSVLGAVGKVAQLPFEGPRVSLAEALGRAGGPSEQQADPTAVYVFRWSATGEDGQPTPSSKPLAYRVDLMKAQSYLLTQRFEMRPRDVLFIANAASNQPAKLLQILNLVFQPFYTAKVITQ